MNTRLESLRQNAGKRKFGPNTFRIPNRFTMTRRVSRARVVRVASFFFFVMSRLNRRLYVRGRLLHNNEIEFIDQNAFDSQTKLLLLYLGRSFHFFFLVLLLN